MTHAALPTSQDDPGVSRLFGAVDHWSSRTPTAPAFAAPDGSLDFHGLALRTRSIVTALARAGVGKETVVAVTTGRSRLAASSLLAVWWLGATAVPIDDRNPAERIAYLLEDARAEVLLAHGVPPFAASSQLPVIDPETAAKPVSGNPVLAERDSCAYVIYTSGTSGKPKGVEISYAGLGVFLDALCTIGLTPGGMGLNPLSPAFDGWLWCTFLHLLHGQGTAIADMHADDGEAVDLAARITAIGPRTVSLTPSLIAPCIDALTSVEVVVIAGERCPKALADRLSERHRVLNVYGPTETTIAATWSDTARGDDVSTIGTPLPGYSVRVLDDNGKPVPANTIGELYIGGDGVALGYRNLPDLTAERFVRIGGERFYRTGDLVVAREDGQLEFAGRCDEQVKVRGFRIELAEIEQVAAELPAVTAAAAFVLESGETVGLAVTVADGHDLTKGNALIREHCRARLPEHMVPSVVDFVPALPLTTNGKVDRAELARAAAAARQFTGRAPGTPRETEVCAVWSELLDHSITDVDADFFELGGHSLLAARIVAALRQSTGLKLSIPVLLANPTPALLAEELDRRATAEVAS
ncbi:amino acid adenylation domain-containing protein [Amycolatopsis xylanica]|uniref:Amino acid adenylation domain-containing protein n=1 Tax=Amycolatopsis xylanica TaxID=589385 RepID=A0A1H2UU69_9PSEU|nr:non-ribosomal peptide synthetase [Amycolatopsis xylanica]SDW59641.1 amino acid adenylation domain-containing protein [Amycolatopsis xylanica]